MYTLITCVYVYTSALALIYWKSGFSVEISDSTEISKLFIAYVTWVAFMLVHAQIYMNLSSSFGGHLVQSLTEIFLYI